MNARERRHAAAPVALWACFLGVLASILAAFPGPTEAFRMEIYFSSFGLIALVAAVVRFGRLRPHPLPPDGVVPATGAPSLAVAVIALLGGLAWVYGLYVAYFALPFVGFTIGRLRLERRRRPR